MSLNMFKSENLENQRQVFVVVAVSDDDGGGYVFIFVLNGDFICVFSLSYIPLPNSAVLHCS